MPCWNSKLLVLVATGGVLTLLIVTACGGEQRDADRILTTVTTATDDVARAASQDPAPLPDSAYRVEWKAHTIPMELDALEISQVEVTLINASDTVWPDLSAARGTRPGAGAVRLGYRWWPATEAAPAAGTGYSTVRADLESALHPGDAATFRIELQAPAAPGMYNLELDLVQELVAWFGSLGSEPLLLEVKVR